MNLPELVKNAPELEISKELENIFDDNYNCLIKTITVGDLGNWELIAAKLTTFSMSLNKPWEIYSSILHKRYTAEGTSAEEKVEYLYKFNHACSICLDNLISIMNLSRVNIHDIVNYYHLMLGEISMRDTYFIKDNVLLTVMNYARHCNVGLRVYNNPEINLRPYIFEQVGKELSLPPETFLKAGRVIDEVFHNMILTQLFDVFYHTNKTLLLIPQEKGTYENQDFHKQLMELWLHFFRMMDLLGHDYDSLGRIYSVLTYINNNDGKQS